MFTNRLSPAPFPARLRLRALLAAPAVLGALALWAGQAGLFPPRLGMALYALAATTVLAAAIFSVESFLEASAVERGDAQKARAEQSRMLEAVLSNMGEGVVVADKNGRFLLWNPAAKEIVGIGSRDIEPAAWSKEYGVFLPDGETPYPAENLPLARTLRGERVDEDEQFVRNADAPEGRFLSVTGRPLLEDSGEMLGGVVVIRDVTRRKRAEKELEAFSYSVSHDLRAPLRHIDGFIELLDKRLGPNMDKTAQRYMKTIAAAAKRMGTLIDDLLSFSKMGRAEIKTARVPLSPLIADLRREIKAAQRGRKVEWIIGPLPVVAGDASMLRLAFMNLLSNAVKFTNTRPAARIEIGMVKENGKSARTVLFVRDNGVGFDARYAAKLFGVFQRLHRSDEFEGTGIGLANVRRIVERHGGEVWGESGPEGGAAFFVALPKAGSGGKA